MSMFVEISNTLANTAWEGEGKERQVINFPYPIPINWPMANELNEMIKKVDDQNRSVGDHVKGVVASINNLLRPDFSPLNFLIKSDDATLNGRAYGLMAEACKYCWFDPSALFKNMNIEFSKGILRIGALYHDIGKLISGDYHVVRGVRYMRDVKDSWQHEIEDLFENVNDSRDFWALLRHHDIFGCLCTGEASMPALSDMVSWSVDRIPSNEKRALAYISYLAWLNIADIDSTLLKILGGITTVEAYRYLSDWEDLRNYLADNRSVHGIINRNEFKDWALDVSSHPESTIRRINRLVATSYRKEMGSIAPESNIKAIVEEELRALLGSRLERFCYCFARFCKLDYSLRFFYLLMRDSLLDEKLLERTDDTDVTQFPTKVRPINTSNERSNIRALRKMVKNTCLVLNRLVEDYGNLVVGDLHSSPLIMVDMSGLMRPEATGWAICRSLKESPSRALGWITDEVSIRLYGD
ncbi:MAG: HD domain-containing protein [Bacteroidota bacterium]